MTMSQFRSDGLTFDPASHIYRLAGVVVPNVTGILRDVGYVDDTYFTEWARQRGDAVHRACQYLDEGMLRWDSVDPRIHGHVEAWERYKREAGVVVVQSECKVLSRMHGYCGRLDRILLVKATGKLRLADIKSGVKDDVTGIQLAAYARAWLEETGQAVTDRAGVYVREDGTYEAVPYPATDWVYFEAALRVMAWRRAHGRT